MMGAAVIVFREVLEAALIIGIVLAATQGVVRRGWWIALGVGAGLAGAALVAFFAEAIGSAAEGFGQELLNASVLFAAVLMLGWHNIWMARHGRELAAHMSAVGREVTSGTRPLYALMLVVSLAVLREGAEVVLFLYGIAASSGSNGMLAGGLGGLAAGSAVGGLLYLGLLRIPTRYLFTVTAWMILLLAAGMASQAAFFLNQAGYLPSLVSTVWDTSSVLSESSAVGQLLHTLIGYDDRPSGIQVVFYLITLITIVVCMQTIGRVRAPATAQATPK